jgi:ribonuclease-3
MNKDYKSLCDKLGYCFQQEALLKAALTHRSGKGLNNERLEYLGDSIVNFIIAEEIYRRCPGADEGEMSRLRALLVKGDTLAELAREFSVGEHLLLGTGELKTGGRGRDSILADAMEAIIAAIYLDAGMTVVQPLVVSWYETRLTDLNSITSLKDPKTQLQEYLQSRRLDLPLYEVSAIEGEAHAQTFIVECHVTSLKLITRADGPSRRKAEQKAAERMLQQLGIEP